MSKNKAIAKMSKPLAAKHRARKRLVQALYQNHFNKMSAAQTIEQFLDEQDFNKVDVDFFKDALRYIENNSDKIAGHIDPHLGRDKASLGAVEYAILTIASYELVNHLETPFKVIINEAILMAQEFGAEGGHTFINGVLAKVSNNLRKHETGA
ncbi:MAG: transcription antitermination factor NusB [Proteobacteria bacterium]|nr:transcription antitermination factor NusB [Pseudomonadota bacterium]